MMSLHSNGNPKIVGIGRGSVGKMLATKAGLEFRPLPHPHPPSGPASPHPRVPPGRGGGLSKVAFVLSLQELHVSKSQPAS